MAFKFDQRTHDEWIRQERDAYFRWAAMNLPFPPLSEEEAERRFRNEKLRQAVIVGLKRRHPRLKWIERGVLLRGS
jgi:hypothetical protein